MQTMIWFVSVIVSCLCLKKAFGEQLFLLDYQFNVLWSKSEAKNIAFTVEFVPSDSKSFFKNDGWFAVGLNILPQMVS